MKNDKYILKMREFAQETGTVNAAIYQTIIDNYADVVNMSLIEFAKLCNVSKPSVLNFCYKVGLEGFSELKYIIKQSLSKYEFINSEIVIAKIEEKGNLYKYSEVAKHYIDYAIHVFYTETEKIDNLIKEIDNAKNIYIFGSNLAFYSTKSFMQKIRWNDKNVVLENDINLIESYCSLMNKDSIVIILSLSGVNPWMLQASKWIKKDIFTFGFVGDRGLISNNLKEFILIPSFEEELWDQHSLRAQFLTMMLDMLFMKLYF